MYLINFLLYIINFLSPLLPQTPWILSPSSLDFDTCAYICYCSGLHRCPHTPNRTLIPHLGQFPIQMISLSSSDSDALCWATPTCVHGWSPHSAIALITSIADLLALLKSEITHWDRPPTLLYFLWMPWLLHLAFSKSSRTVSLHPLHPLSPPLHIRMLSFPW